MWIPDGYIRLGQPVRVRVLGGRQDCSRTIDFVLAEEFEEENLNGERESYQTDRQQQKGVS